MLPASFDERPRRGVAQGRPCGGIYLRTQPAAVKAPPTATPLLSASFQTLGADTSSSDLDDLTKLSPLLLYGLQTMSSAETPPESPRTGFPIATSDPAASSRIISFPPEEAEPLLGGQKDRLTARHTLGRETFGLLLLGMSTFGFASMTFLVHVLSAPQYGYKVEPVFLAWTRCVVQFGTAALSLAFVRSDEIIPRLTIRLLLLLTCRGLCGAAALVAFYVSLGFLPLGQMTTVYFISPLFTMALARIFANERVSRAEIFVSFASFIGVVLVAMPSDKGSVTGEMSHRGLGVVLALSAAFLSACSNLLIRKMGTDIHFLVSVSCLGFWGTAVCTMFLRNTLWSKLADLLEDHVVLALVAAQSLSALFGQCCYNKALQHCRGYNVIIRNIDVPVAYSVGVLFLGEVPSPIACFGAVLVFCATSVVTILRTRVSQR